MPHRSPFYEGAILIPLTIGDRMDIVSVNRKGHPLNPVRVERADMLKDDVIVDPNEPKKPAPKKKAARTK